MAELKKKIKEKLSCHDKGPISLYLNLLITRDRSKRTICISAPTKIQAVLNDDQLSSEDVKTIKVPSKIPALPSIILTKPIEPLSDEENQHMAEKPYRSILGQLIHISITARPDISTAVSCCGQFSQNPGKIHWQAILQILKYLNGTKDYSYN